MPVFFFNFTYDWAWFVIYKEMSNRLIMALVIIGLFISLSVYIVTEPISDLFYKGIDMDALSF